MTAPPLQFNAPGIKTREIDASTYSTGQGATVAALIGVFEKGPVGVATLVQSFPEAQRLFGNFLAAYYSMHAVRQFFDQGGQALYIVRTAHYTAINDKTTLTAIKATKTLSDRGGTPQNTLRVDALSEGAWANGATGGLAIDITAGTVDPTNNFRLRVYFNGQVVEDFDNLTMDPTNTQDYAENRINAISSFVTVTDLGSTNAAPSNLPALLAVASGDLASGSDGLAGLADADFTGDSGASTGLFAFDTAQSIRILVAPGRTGATVAAAMLTYCANRADCYAIIETPSGLTPAQAAAYRNQTSPYSGTAFDNSYGGLYWPWPKFADPVTGQVRFFPPSGAIAGLFAASDTLAGPWNAVSGIARGLLRGCLGLETDVTEAVAEVVWPNDVNPIVRKEGTGFVVWGQNTLQRRASATDRANVRRMLIEVEATLTSFAEQLVMFEPITPLTWASFKRAANSYLATVKDRQGINDYFVKVDGDNNPPSVIEQNRVNIDIYLKPTKTAEFITLSFTVTQQGVDFAEAFAQK